MLRIDQIKLSLDEAETTLEAKILNLLKIPKSELVDYKIYRKNIDARRQTICFVYSVDVILKDEAKILRKHKTKVRKSPSVNYEYPKIGNDDLQHRPIIVGFGPAGMFCALTLARLGYQPIVLEQGSAVEERIADVAYFLATGELNETSNIQFGEGGAGTFSDGKLTARTKDLRVHKIYQELVAHGAPEAILYEAFPHVGSDKLIDLVRNIRHSIEMNGGEVRFQSKVEGLHKEQGSIVGVQVAGQVIYSDVIVLALGNSARDSFYTFYEQGLAMESKPFAIGVRIEHEQESINEALYHAHCHHESLPVASYRLSDQSSGKGVYTFCMCPGGTVVAATSQSGHVVVNGMSNYARDQQNANAAVLVQVDEQDYGTGVFAGIEYQEELEKKAFLLGGSNYQAPAQKVSDMIDGCEDGAEVMPSYPLGVTYIDMKELLPTNVYRCIKQGMHAFQQKNQAFRNGNAIMTGIETRSSSPIRMLRNDQMESLTFANVYPIGEGSGYAGGIISSAIDGLKCAERIVEQYRPCFQK